VTYLKVSTVDPSWVVAAIGFYNAQGQPDTEGSAVILNLSTHQLIGPSPDGFCGGPTGPPFPAYGALSDAVLAGLGLKPCSSSTTTTTGTAPGDVLAGSYALTVALGDCGPGVRSNDDVMYVEGTAVNVTDPGGPLNGTLTTEGSSYGLKLVQPSKEIEDDLTITVSNGGDNFTAAGRLYSRASSGGVQFPPCAVEFTGSRT
jgi:hypothetical protein